MGHIREKKASVERPLTHAEILESLYSQKCPAGNHKKAAGATFCARCIHKLPMDLYRPLLAGGDSYDAAYIVATRFLSNLKGGRAARG
jgi:hypothetical protein